MDGLMYTHSYHNYSSFEQHEKWNIRDLTSNKSNLRKRHHFIRKIFPNLIRLHSRWKIKKWCTQCTLYLDTFSLHIIYYILWRRRRRRRRWKRRRLWRRKKVIQYTRPSVQEIFIWNKHPLKCGDFSIFLSWIIFQEDRGNFTSSTQSSKSSWIHS